MTCHLALRVDEQLSRKFNEFCAGQGKSVNFAMRLFMSYYVREGAAAFCYTMPPSDESGIVRQRSYLVSEELLCAFKEAVEQDPMAASMSDLVRSYMRYCVANNAFPAELFKTTKKRKD